MFRKRIFWILLIALVLVVAGGAYYYYNNVYLLAQEPEEEPAIATATASRGDLVITASGSGMLVPAAEVTLGFPGSGVLAELSVRVGDEVEAGQVVARLDNTDVQDQVTQAEINLRQAELSLAELGEEPDPADVAAAEASLASAQADLSNLTSPPSEGDLLAAQENLRSAQSKLDDLLALPDEDLVEIAQADLTLAEMALRTAQTAYDKVAWREDIGVRQESADLWQATTNYERTKAEYQDTLKGATDDELADARSEIALAQSQLDELYEEIDADALASAQAKVIQAQAQMDSLLAGPSAGDLEAAELNVAQAQLNLESAKRALAEVELVATAAGTVTAVEAQVGESVGSSPIISLANLEEPEVQFWVEEADMASVAPGNRVDVVFEALPEITFPGEILRVDPVLVTVDGTPAVQSYASVDLTAHPITLLSGMNAEVEVVAGEARNAVLVPLQALRDLGPDLYGVFVVGPGGKMEMRIVEVGLRDFVNAEILSGLEPGEVVSTGTESSSEPTEETPAGGQQPPPGGGFMRILGG